MRKALTALLAVSAVAFTAVYLPSATPTSAASCDDIKIIYARGSGQTLNMKEYQTFESNIKSDLAGLAGVTYSFYELGSSSYGGHRYPAIGLNFFNIVTAKMSAGGAFEYGKSVAEGSAELTSYIDTISKGCPNTKFVLAGYSQGAQVISVSAPNINPDKIIYAATFGDPKLYLPEGKGITPPACAGENLSDYRAYVPNCKTYQGSLGAKKPYEESGWAGKLGLYCNDKDLVCGSGLNIDPSGNDNPFENIRNNALVAHTSYANLGTIKLATDAIVDRIKSNYHHLEEPAEEENRIKPIHNYVLFNFADMKYKLNPTVSYADHLLKKIHYHGTLTFTSFYHNTLFKNLASCYMSTYKEDHNIRNVSPLDSSTWSYITDGEINTRDSLTGKVRYILEHPVWSLDAEKTIYIVTNGSVPSERQEIETLTKLAEEQYDVKIIPITYAYGASNEFVLDEMDTSVPIKNSTPKNAVFAESAPATITDLSYNLSDEQELTISYKLNGIAAMVSINDAPLGITQQEKLEITEVSPGSKITITPINEQGNIGELVEIIVQNTSEEPKEATPIEQSQSTDNTSENFANIDINTSTDINKNIATEAVDATINKDTATKSATEADTADKQKASTKITKILAPNTGRR